MDPTATPASPGKQFCISTTKYIPQKNLAALLNFGDEPVTELSADGWEDDETLMDELSTFFPFPRNFNREWPEVQKYSVELCKASGRLIIIRAINEKGLSAVNRFVATVGSIFDQGAPQERVVVVLEKYPAKEVTFEGKRYAVTPLPNEPETNFPADTYQIQVSGKRNHTYYVNVALRIFKRRPWYNRLELSGLGNAIPSIVSITEILKRYKIVKELRIETSLAELVGEGASSGRFLHKSKIVLLLEKPANVPQA